MKKILSIIVATLLVCSCFVFSVAAEGTAVAISDDYSELRIDSNTFIQVEDTSLYVECDFVINNEVTLSEAQSKAIKSVDLYSDESGNVIEADLEMKIGSYATVIYMNSEGLKEYNSLKKRSEYTVDFGYPEGNKVKTASSDLFGTPVTLYEEDLYACDYYYVYAESSESSMSLCKGMMLSGANDWYYLDCEQVGIEDPYDFDLYEATELDVYKITDPLLTSDLLDAETAYFEEDMLNLFGGTDVLFGGVIVVLFVFVIILLGVFVTFLILGICSKTKYRKLFFTICAVAGCALAAVIVTAVYVLSIV